MRVFIYAELLPGYRGISSIPTDDHREYIKKIVDAAPPLMPEQRARLRELLRPVAIDLRTETESNR
jgi:hypothetical protein